MWAHVACVFITAANFASYVVAVLVTNCLRQSTAKLIGAVVGHLGYAIFLEKGPKALVCSNWASYQILVLVAFQSTLFTVIFSATALITLQSHYWWTRRQTGNAFKTHSHLKSVLVLSNAGLSVCISKTCPSVGAWGKKRQSTIFLDVWIFYLPLLQEKFAWLRCGQSWQKTFKSRWKICWC